MFIYFRIRYLEKDELDSESQIEFMRNYIEKICNLNKNGLRYKGYIERKLGKVETVLVKYSVAKKTNPKKIETIMKSHDVMEELLAYISMENSKIKEK